MTHVATCGGDPALKDYLPPAERLRMFRSFKAEMDSAWASLPSELRDDSWSEEVQAREKLRMWWQHSSLYVPQTHMGMPAEDRARVMRSRAYGDWRRRQKVKRRVSVRFRRIVIQRAQGRCAYCGGEVPDRYFVVDHVFPVRWGGRSHLSNLIGACWICNRDKSDDIWKPLYFPPGFRWPRWLAPGTSYVPSKP